MVVRDEAYVRLVDAHAEGVRGDDHLPLARHEGVLRGLALGVLHPGVVGDDAQSRVMQAARHLLDRLACRGVDDTRAAGVCGGQRADVRDLLALLLRVRDAQREVRAVEAGNERERLAQAQLLDDVGAHVRGGRRGERDYLRASD